jgi:hypothetical protein
LAFVGLWIVVTAALFLAPGCYGRNCEGDAMGYGSLPGQGRMLDDTTWESSPIDGAWLHFPRQRYYFFDIPELGGRLPSVVIPTLSAVQVPDDGGDSTLGAGNIALLLNYHPNHVEVKNDTCSDYYLRLVILVPPLPPSNGDAGALDTATLVDASSTKDANTSDAEAGL